jgi:tRNA threonylcarbamoyladenosine biosynthesis protein TsaE
MNFRLTNPTDIEKAAQEFLDHCQPLAQATIVGLFGDLGAGKTTFTQTVARILGVNETVTSPTFILEKIYKLEGQKYERLIHIDAYRLEKPEELLTLGWKELAEDSHNLIMIEWPEKVAGMLPDQIHELRFSHVDDTTRDLTMTFV